MTGNTFVTEGGITRVGRLMPFVPFREFLRNGAFVLNLLSVLVGLVLRDARLRSLVVEIPAGRLRLNGTMMAFVPGSSKIRVNTMDIEVWKDIPGYEGSYQVSDKGQVRSLDRLGKLGQKLRGRLLKQGVDPNWYYRVRLTNRLGSKTVNTHYLVLLAFVGPADHPSLVCRHLDGNSRNNNLDNLKWGTCSENSHDMVNHGRGSGGKWKGWPDMALKPQNSRFPPLK